MLFRSAQHMPDLYSEYGNEIREACCKKFDTVFKILSAMDMYYHAVLMLRFFDANSTIKKHKKVEHVLKKIVVICRHYLEVGMRKLAKNLQWECNEWPNMEIIKRCFDDNMVDLNDTKTMEEWNVVDFFNYENPEQYKFHTPADAPPRFGYVKLADKDWGVPGYKKLEVHSRGTQARERQLHNDSEAELIKAITKLNPSSTRPSKGARRSFR